MDVERGKKRHLTQRVYRLFYNNSALRETRDKVLSVCIEKVKEQVDKQSNIDDIDAIIHRQAAANSEKICVACGCEADPSFRICRNCGGKLMKPTQETLDIEDASLRISASFSDFQSTCPKSECVTGEPDFINPNSYKNIIQVLQNIGFRAGIEQYSGGTRKWLIVECDGLPYNTMRDIMINVWRCTNCSDCYYGLEAFNEHKCKILHNTILVREFRWLLPTMRLR